MGIIWFPRVAMQINLNSSTFSQNCHSTFMEVVDHWWKILVNTSFLQQKSLDLLHLCELSWIYAYFNQLTLILSSLLLMAVRKSQKIPTIWSTSDANCSSPWWIPWICRTYIYNFLLIVHRITQLKLSDLVCGSLHCSI